MGRTRKLLGLTVLGAVALPPLAAAIVRSRYQVSAEDSDDLRVASFFEGRQARVTSSALRRAEAIAWYGALDLDLRGADLDPAGARLRVVALFAGARVIVPTGWDVRVRPVGIMGGVYGWTEPPTGPAPRLTVDAIAVFSGIEVTDRPTEDEPDVMLEPPPPGRSRSGPEAAEPAAPETPAPMPDFERAEAEAASEAEASSLDRARADEAEA
jgi:hypothetical protein